MRKFSVSTFSKKYGTVAGLVILCIVFSLLKPQFFTINNILIVLRQIAMLSIMGAGLTVVMITKRIDLSIGYATSFLGIFCAALLVDFGVPFWVAIILTLVCGALIGLINGVAVAVIGIPDFIATLCVGQLVSGVNQAYTHGHPISGLPNLFDIFGASSLFSIPSSIYIMIIFLIIIYIVLTHTKFGRYTYAIGGNEIAAMMSGVKVKKNQVLGYMLCGVAMGITALVLTSRLGSAHPLAADGLMMDAIATVYLGSTAFKEGEPNLAGTFVGALFIGVLSNGMTLLSEQYYITDITKGLVILLAVTVTSIQRNKKK